MSDTPVKPWTVKGISPEDRNAALHAADMQRMLIGAWLSRAIRTQIQADLRRETGVTVVDSQVKSPVALPEAAYQPTSLVTLIEAAVQASDHGLSENVRKAIDRALISELHELRQHRRVSGKPHGSSDPNPRIDRGRSPHKVQDS